MTERLFLGIYLYPLFQQEIESVAGRLKLVFPDQKWVNLKFVHFTIRFLGDVETGPKKRVCEVTKAIAEQTQPFSVALEGLDAFPNKKNPKVVWLGAAGECQKLLVDLYERITQPLIAEGFPVEHATFTAHATLFRVQPTGSVVWDDLAFQFKRTGFKKIDRFYLFKSTLKPSGAEYQPIDEFRFGRIY